MKANTQKELAREANISEGFLSQILKGDKNPSWRTAKRLSAAVPSIPPQDWIEKSGAELRAALLRSLED